MPVIDILDDERLCAVCATDSGESLIETYDRSQPLPDHESACVRCGVRPFVEAPVYTKETDDD